MQNYNSKFKFLKNLKKELPEIQRNIFLAKHTTFHIGGRARYFFEAKDKEGLIKAILAAKKFRLPFFILGKGSNLLVADEGYRGLIINFQFSIFNFSRFHRGSSMAKPSGQSIFNSKIFKIVAGAGLSLRKLVNASVDRGLTGLEWAVGIPGTVGGAIWGNAGAFGSSMKDIVKSVEIIEIADDKIQNSKFQIPNKFKIQNSKFKILQNKDCKFGYRKSIFKKNKNLIILSAVLEFKKGEKNKIKEKMIEFSNYRKKTQPLNFPSVGSIFKNPKGFFAAELIEKCGLKGKRVGNAKISEKHANFIVNLGGAKATDVKKLIILAKEKIKKKFKIELKEEIQHL